MRSSLAAILVLASTTGTFAWGPGFGGGWANWPSCATSCMSVFTGSSCAGDGSCLCKDQASITSANSCVASSSCSDADKQTIYQNIAQLCADVGTPVTSQAPEATYSITSTAAWTGGPFANGAFSSAFANGNGYGPFGGGFGPFQSGGSWTAGPWSKWWDGSACPSDAWSGWTSGPWSTSAPWTTWSACTATTTATSIFTTTDVSGAVITSTNFGIKVAEQTGTGSANSAASSSTSAAVASVTGAGGAANNLAKIGLTFVVVTFVIIVQG